jgi:hypothetical protein
MIAIVLPLLVIDALGYSEAVVGLAYAVSGLSGIVSAFLFGRVDTRGREWIMLVVPLVLFGPAVALMLPVTGVFGPLDPLAGLALIVASQFLFGLLAGPLDIALFTIRQRRTDPAWLGRAFAVSMTASWVIRSEPRSPVPSPRVDGRRHHGRRRRGGRLGCHRRGADPARDRAAARPIVAGSRHG